MRDTHLDSTDLTWLAGLARALLGEAHAADDLVQETVVAALEGSPPSGAPRRAWLASVARRLAARRFRGEARRAEREQRVARGETLPDSTALVERAEVAEQVTAAARRLREPYRRAVLLRFLEGLTAEEIARDEDRPVDTVRWRIRRGLELLRDDLVRRHDREWSAWSVLLMPLARSRSEVGLATAGSSGLFTGTVATWSAMKLTTLAAATLCGAGLWILWGSTDETGIEVSLPEGAEADEVVLAEPALKEPAATPRVESRSGRAAALVDSGADEPGVTSDPESDGLFGKVVDVRGEPVMGAVVYVVPSVGEEQQTERRSAASAPPRTESDRRGTFRIPREASESVPASNGRSVSLGVVANGFLRKMVPDAVRSQNSDGLLVVLEDGRRLSGRVVDENGAAVPDLELLAHTAYAGIAHVSPSQMLLRAQRARLGDAASKYDQSRSRTDGRGEVAFNGLPAGELRVRSLDPAWTIEEPSRVEAGGPYVVWTAARRLGVRLDVVSAYTGRAVEQAAATFRFELTFADGEVRDFGQWVGRGEGGVSFVIGPDVLPGLEERTVTRAAFYGTVRSGATEQPWVADAIEDALGASGIAEVRVELDDRAGLAAEEAASAIVGDVKEPPTSTLELDVRYADAMPFEGELSVSWTCKTDSGPVRERNTRPEAVAPGRYRLDVAVGDVTLEVADRAASGGMPRWSDTVRCDADRSSTAFVTLPRGAAVTIPRPQGWSGEWFVHAKWRPPGDASWQGGLGYSTAGASLTLTVLRPAEWRFQLRRVSALAPDPLVRTVVLTEGDNAVVDE